MSILYISTHVDEVMDILRTRHTMELKELADIVGLPESRVENWCNVLEEQGLIKLEHRLTKIFVHWISDKKFTLLDRGAIKKETFVEDYHVEPSSIFASVKEEVERSKSRIVKKKGN